MFYFFDKYDLSSHIRQQWWLGNHKTLNLACSIRCHLTFSLSIVFEVSSYANYHSMKKTNCLRGKSSSAKTFFRILDTENSNKRVSRLFFCFCFCFCFHTEDLKSAQELVQNVSVHSGYNWKLEVLVFEERGKPEYPEKKLSKERNNKKLNSHMAKGPGIEPGPHFWEASALTTAPLPPSPPPSANLQDEIVKLNYLFARKGLLHRLQTASKTRYYTWLNLVWASSVFVLTV